MPVSWNDSELIVGKTKIVTRWPVRYAFDDGFRVIVLLNPNAYILAPGYQEARRAGMAAPRNLLAYSHAGQIIWEAELPEEADYFYAIVSKSPLRVYSFSSFDCQIDAATGRTIARRFFK